MENAAAPVRARVSGLRAEALGDLVFMDHCEVELSKKKYHIFLILDGASNLLWARPVSSLEHPESQEAIREWMDNHQVKIKSVCADMAFFTPVWDSFWKSNDVKKLPTGDRTPWPNRAETAVRLFKKQFKLLCKSVVNEPELVSTPVKDGGLPTGVTIKQLCRVACWARNNQLMISGKSPLEIAFGRPPVPTFDLEVATPEQVTTNVPAGETRERLLKRLAMQAHLEARQMKDLQTDIARNLKCSKGPYYVGDRVFFWKKDKSKVKDQGEWVRGRVTSVNPPMLGIDDKREVRMINITKVRLDKDHWHDVTLPLDQDTTH